MKYKDESGIRNQYLHHITSETTRTKEEKKSMKPMQLIGCFNHITREILIQKYILGLLSHIL